MSNLTYFIENLIYNTLNIVTFNVPDLIISIDPAEGAKGFFGEKVLVFEPAYIPQDNISQLRKLFRCFNNIINNLFDFFNSFKKESSHGNCSSQTNNKTYSSSAENEIPKSETSETNYYGNGEDTSSSPEKGNYYGNGEDTSSSTEKGDYYGNGEEDISVSVISEENLLPIKSETNLPVTESTVSSSKYKFDIPLEASHEKRLLEIITSNRLICNNPSLHFYMLDKTVGCIENFYDCLWGRVKMYETNQNIYDIVVKPLLKDNLSIDETLTKSYYINMQKFFSNNLFLFYPEICAFIYKNELLGISTGHLLKAIEPQACNIFNNTLNRDIFEHRNKFLKYFNGDSYDMISLSPEYYDINKKGINKIIDLMFDNYKPYFEYFYENIQNNNKYLFETPEKLEVLKMNLIFEVISKYSYFIRGELYQYNCMYNNYTKSDYTLNLSKISLIAERQALCLIINYIPNQSFNTESLTNYFYQCEPECPHKIDIKDLVSRNKHIVPFYETNFLMLAEVKYINNLKIQIN